VAIPIALTLPARKRFDIGLPIEFRRKHAANGSARERRGDQPPQRYFGMNSRPKILTTPSTPSSVREIGPALRGG